MEGTGENGSETSRAPGYGCFWIAGGMGAFLITALVVGDGWRSPGEDAPLGGMFWLVAQGGCLITCLIGACRATFDKAVHATQRRRMWILTLYPLILLLILMALNH